MFRTRLKAVFGCPGGVWRGLPLSSYLRGEEVKKKWLHAFNWPWCDVLGYCRCSVVLVRRDLVFLLYRWGRDDKDKVYFQSFQSFGFSSKTWRDLIWGLGDVEATELSRFFINPKFAVISFLRSYRGGYLWRSFGLGRPEFKSFYFPLGEAGKNELQYQL